MGYNLKNILGYLTEGKGEKIILTSDEAPIIITKDKRYRLGDASIDKKTITEMIHEIIPSQLKDKIDNLKNTSFQSGDFDCLVNINQNDAYLEIAKEKKEIVKASVEDSTEKSVDKYLKTMVELKGSDLHIKPGDPPIIRIDGELKKLEDAPVITASDTTKMLYTLLDERHKEELEKRFDTDFAYEIADVARFRVNIYREKKGLSGAFRFIPTKIVTAEDIGLSEAVRKLCYLSKGLVLVTDPTGSGKSTTLCALIDLVNRVRHDHIITIEDPIEFVHENKNCIISQREIGTDAESFSRALRAALREDPNVVLIGEMSDLETISVTLETTETGHPVFGTLHTSTASTTVNRIIEQFPVDQQEQIRVMLADSLKTVISQTLCRKKEAGRIAAFEILIVTSVVSNLIRENKTYQIDSIIQTQQKLGMVTMNDCLTDLVSKDIIHPEEAYRKAIDKLSLIEKIQSKGIDTSFLNMIDKKFV